MQFDWGSTKAEINLKKHGVCFEEEALYLKIFWRESLMMTSILLMKSASESSDIQERTAC